MIRATIRLGFLGLLLTGLPSGPLYADLTTGGALSLEWLVDSSDAVYLIWLREETQPDTHFLAERENALKIPADAEAVEQIHHVIDQWQVPRYYQPRRNSDPARNGDQWLVFIRTWEEKPPTIVAQINLTRPLERSATAAINADGVPLSDKRQILQAITERVGLNRQLSGRARQVREHVDKGPRGFSPFGDPAPLESSLGGLQITIDCDLWAKHHPPDEHGYHIHNEDLLLQSLIIPADPKYHQQLLQAVRQRHPLLRHPLFENRATFYLVNYPGEETERVLEELPPGVAKRVLWYFKFRHEISDPLNDDLVGRWRLVGQRELIDLTLNDDNTFTASGFTRPLQEGEAAQYLWQGKGYWVVRDKQLTLWRQHFLHPKRGWMDAHYRTIFEDKGVVEMSPERVVLEEGPLMLKREGGDSN